MMFAQACSGVHWPARPMPEGRPRSDRAETLVRVGLGLVRFWGERLAAPRRAQPRRCMNCGRFVGAASGAQLCSSCSAQSARDLGTAMKRTSWESTPLASQLLLGKTRDDFVVPRPSQLHRPPEGRLIGTGSRLMTSRSREVARRPGSGQVGTGDSPVVGARAVARRVIVWVALICIGAILGASMALLSTLVGP